jgi:hypothetical protein
VDGTFILLLVAEPAWKAGFARTGRLQDESQRAVINSSSSCSNHWIRAYEILDVSPTLLRTHPGRVAALAGTGRPFCWSRRNRWKARSGNSQIPEIPTLSCTGRAGQMVQSPKRTCLAMSTYIPVGIYKATIDNDYRIIGLKVGVYLDPIEGTIDQPKGS